MIDNSNKSFFNVISLLVVLSIITTIAGCGQSVSSKDLGTIIYKIPQVQGADQPYDLPKIITPNADATISNTQDQEGTKTGQGEADKQAEHEQPLPDNSNSPKPTPAQRRP
jgi:hypothetical protein